MTLRTCSHLVLTFVFGIWSQVDSAHNRCECGRDHITKNNFRGCQGRIGPHNMVVSFSSKPIKTMAGHKDWARGSWSKIQRDKSKKAKQKSTGRTGLSLWSQIWSQMITGDPLRCMIMPGLCQVICSGCLAIRSPKTDVNTESEQGLKDKKHNQLWMAGTN